MKLQVHDCFLGVYGCASLIHGERACNSLALIKETGYKARNSHTAGEMLAVTKNSTSRACAMVAS